MRHPYPYSDSARATRRSGHGSAGSVRAAKFGTIDEVSLSDLNAINWVCIAVRRQTADFDGPIQSH